MNDQEIQNMEEEIDLSQYSTEEIEGMVLRTRDRKLAKIAELEASIASLEGDEKLSSPRRSVPLFSMRWRTSGT